MKTPKKPPELEKKIPPVRGDFVTNENLPLVGIVVPPKGPVAKIMIFSGLKGSTLAGIRSVNNLTPSPLPPK